MPQGDQKLSGERHDPDLPEALLRLRAAVTGVRVKVFRELARALPLQPAPSELGHGRPYSWVPGLADSLLVLRSSAVVRRSREAGVGSDLPPIPEHAPAEHLVDEHCRADDPDATELHQSVDLGDVRLGSRLLLRSHDAHAVLFSELLELCLEEVETIEFPQDLGKNARG